MTDLPPPPLPPAPHNFHEYPLVFWILFYSSWLIKYLKVDLWLTVFQLSLGVLTCESPLLSGTLGKTCKNTGILKERCERFHYGLGCFWFVAHVKPFFSLTILGSICTNIIMIENDVLFSNDTGILGKRNSEFSQQESNLRLSNVNEWHMRNISLRICHSLTVCRMFVP